MRIDQKLLDTLTKQAKVSPRLRMNYDLRNNENDLSQRMLNAIEPGTIVPVHRHQKSSETIVVLRGHAVEIIFDDLGHMVNETYDLYPNGECVAVNVPAGQWHTIQSFESGTVILEVKDGPYEPTNPVDVLY
jgi:cupin fold WbuC family metalloprotein